MYFQWAFETTGVCFRDNRLSDKWAFGQDEMSSADSDRVVLLGSFQSMSVVYRVGTASNNRIYQDIETFCDT